MNQAACLLQISDKIDGRWWRRRWWYCWAPPPHPAPRWLHLKVFGVPFVSCQPNQPADITNLCTLSVAGTSLHNVKLNPNCPLPCSTASMVYGYGIHKLFKKVFSSKHRCIQTNAESPVYVSGTWNLSPYTLCTTQFTPILKAFGVRTLQHTKQNTNWAVSSGLLLPNRTPTSMVWANIEHSCHLVCSQCSKGWALNIIVASAPRVGLLWTSNIVVAWGSSELWRPSSLWARAAACVENLFGACAFGFVLHFVLWLLWFSFCAIF